MRIICVFACTFCVFIVPALSSNNLPSEYTELEYIKSTGTQWINTGIIPTLDYTVEVKAIKDIKFSIFGSGFGDYTFTGNEYNYAYIGLYSGGALRVACDNQDQPHIWKISNRTAYCDNNASSVSSYTTQPTLPLALFARTTSATTADDIGSHTMYYAKIYNESGTLVANFIPARRNSDNVVGMYDTVSNTFFTNAGTGSFVAGPMVGIGIATTKYVETAFADSVSELNSTIGTIKTVVDNTIIQADRIGKLATGKQTRPDEQCPSNAQCLLITEADGSLHWYPICNGDGSIFDTSAFFTAFTNAGKPDAKGTTDSSSKWMYYNAFCKGLSAWRQKYVDGSTNTYDRPFAHATRCTNPNYTTQTIEALPCYTETGMYKTLTDGEWAVVYDGDEKTNNASTPVDPGVIYGISKCVSTKLTGAVSKGTKATTAQLADSLFDATPADTIDAIDYSQCWCKMSAIGLPGDGSTVADKAANGGIVNVSGADWIYFYTYDSARDCASYCTNGCTANVHRVEAFRAAVVATNN